MSGETGHTEIVLNLYEISCEISKLNLNKKKNNCKIFFIPIFILLSHGLIKLWFKIPNKPAINLRSAIQPL
jgi:hypothetical protein